MRLALLKDAADRGWETPRAGDWCFVSVMRRNSEDVEAKLRAGFTSMGVKSLRCSPRSSG